MASQYDIDINIDVQSASLGELEGELSRLNEEIKKIPRNSAEFNKAASNVRKVTGEVDKANKSLQKIDVGQLVGDFAKVGAAIGAVGIALNTFGEEGSKSNEQIQKTLERTQAILALVAVAEGAVSAARLASTAATKAYTIAQNLANKAVQAGSISLKGLRAALISTGVGAFVVLLGAIIANFDKIQDWFSGGQEAKRQQSIDDLEAGLTKVNEVLAGQLAQIDAEESRGSLSTIEALQKKQEAQRQYYLEVNRLTSQRLNDLTVEKLQGKDVAEEEAKVLKERFNASKAYTDAVRAAVNEDIKITERRNKEVIELAKARGEDTYELELDNLRDRLRLLQQFGTAFAEEIRQTEAEITRIQAAEAERRRQAQIARAKERRSRIKGELNEIAQIIQTDPIRAVENLNDQQARTLELLEKFSGGSRDITKIIKELRKEGLDPLANQFEAIADEGNLAKFTELINKYYGEQIKAILTGTVANLDSFESRFETITASTARFIDNFGGDIIQTQEIFEGFYTFVDDFGEEFQGRQSQSLSSFIFGSFENALSDVKQQRDLLEKELIDFNKQLRQELFAQAAAGILSPEQVTEELAFLQVQLAARLKALNEEAAANVDLIIQTQFAAIDRQFRGAITTAQRAIDAQENLYVGWEGFLRSFNDDRLAEERELTRNLLAEEDKRLEAQKSSLKTALDEGVITEQDYADRVNDIDEQLYQNQLTRTKLLNEERLQGLQEALAVYQELFSVVSAYSDFVGSQAEAENAQLDVKIAKLERDLELRLQGITDEEKRAQVTAKAEAQIEAAKNEQIKNTAEAQKKQAKLTFALTAGQIVANTAEAIIKTLAQLGPIAGPIAAGLIATTGALQLAAANNAKNAALAQADAQLASISGSLSGAGGGGGRTQFAEGGYVSGPGTGTSDSISARLSNGEYVINAASTAAFLPLLEQINNTGRRFADGGMATNGPDITDVLMRIERRLATPPKAYVVSTEIQKGLDTDEYLERRAQLT